MRKKIVLMVMAQVILWADLRDDYLALVNKYNEGTIYTEESLLYFRENSPFKSGISFDLYGVDFPTLQSEYLTLVKRMIRGILDQTDVPEGDRPHNPKIMKEYAYTHCSGEAINTLRSLMEDVERNHVPGDFVETGVWRGGLTIFMKAFLRAYGDQKRRVWVADSFEGWPPATNDPDSLECNNQKLPWIVVPEEVVKNNFKRCGLLDDKVVFLKGWFKDTLAVAPIEKIAILRVDGDLYESTRDSLEALYPKLVTGGWVIIDDYDYFPGCNRAVEEYRKANNITGPVFRQGKTCSGICWKKT